jgi:hypothetical protein
MIETFHESSKKTTDGGIFVSGAYPKPMIGRQAISVSDTAMTQCPGRDPQAQ